MTRLVVTGANGYVGGAVVAAARRRNVEVIPVTRRAASWLGPRTSVVEDLAATAAGIVEGADAVVHLAGPNEAAAELDPDGSLASTVGLARSVSLGCASAGVRRLVYVSTVHVYGSALAGSHDVDESTLPLPRSAYAIARLASEHVISANAGVTEVVLLRLANAIGPPSDISVERWTLVGNDLCRQAAAGGPIRLHSAGYQWRDFVALDNVADIVCAAAEPDRVPPGTYNVASGRPVTIRDLAGLVSQQAVSLGMTKPEILAPPGDGSRPEPPHRIRSDRLRRLGLAATCNIEGSIRDTLTFCASHFP